MLKINIISVGSIKESYIKNGINEFSKRISKYANIFFIELKESKKDSLASLKEEQDAILKNIKKGFNIILDIKGKKLNSLDFAKLLDDIKSQHSEINFIIGSSHGLSNKVKKEGDLLISFSDLTFPHQLFKLILVEQIYRGLSINSGGKYHK